MLTSRKIFSVNSLPGDPVGASVRTEKPGDWILIKAIKRKNWSSPRWEGPFQILVTTPTTHKMAEKPSWMHLSHCKLVKLLPEDKERD